MIFLENYNGNKESIFLKNFGYRKREYRRMIGHRAEMSIKKS